MKLNGRICLNNLKRSLFLSQHENGKTGSPEKLFENEATLRVASELNRERTKSRPVTSLEPQDQAEPSDSPSSEHLRYMSQ